MAFAMNRTESMYDHPWIDPENDPADPSLLFAKSMVALLQEGNCVDFSSGKPFVMDRDEPFLSNKGSLLSFQTGGTSFVLMFSFG